MNLRQSLVTGQLSDLSHHGTHLQVITNPEVLLNQIKHEFLQIPHKCLPYSCLFKEEWLAIKPLEEDRSIVIKKAGKGS